jgi:hypothetical protein
VNRALLLPWLVAAVLAPAPPAGAAVECLGRPATIQGTTAVDM